MPNAFVKVRIENAQITKLNRDLKLEGKALEKAGSNAFKNAGKTFVKLASDNLSKKFDMTKKVIRSRIKSYVVNVMKVKVFAGLYRLGLTRWSAREVKTGVSYGASGQRQIREHAFIVKASQKSSSRVAFKRTGSFKTASKGRYEGQKREKLEKQVTDIDDLFLPELEKLSTEFSEMFEKEFNKEARKWIVKQLQT